MERLHLIDFVYIFCGLVVLLASPVIADKVKQLFHYYFVMSSGVVDSVDTGTVPSIPEVVPALPNAEHTSTESETPQPNTPSISHNMKRVDLIVVLAVQKFDGKYVFSANKIAELFAGTELRISRNKILEEIDQIRNGVKSPTPVNGHTDRPQEGW